MRIYEFSSNSIKINHESREYFSLPSRGLNAASNTVL